MGLTARNTTANYVEKRGITSFSRWTLSSLNNPLALDFAAFTAQCIQGDINQDWTAAQEQNVAYFEIEYSIDAVSWRSTGYATLKGNTHTYHFKDDRNEGYYRIAALDKDGGKLYSGIRHAACNSIDMNVVIWPNPATEKVFVKLNVAANDNLGASIYDAKGVMVSRQDNPLAAGENQVALTLDNLATDVYGLNLEWNNLAGRKSVKVVKQ